MIVMVAALLQVSVFVGCGFALTAWLTGAGWASHLADFCWLLAAVVLGVGGALIATRSLREKASPACQVALATVRLAMTGFWGGFALMVGGAVLVDDPSVVFSGLIFSLSAIAVALALPIHIVLENRARSNRPSCCSNDRQANDAPAVIDDPRTLGIGRG